ncbi:hypothetical protein K435DRAFT_149025 [Dendrothele bispora CBS 962.96]|uniref:J domain-containing protein n=1 Tax=Dendrothele bispora (strain CBS 962.96) TaxID=1314807 RepID=A0A4S8MPM1_DENBC|nr:hypothetical protein K435DRAFT_149025 [Dendrothele bispora CBS 962.96]
MLVRLGLARPRTFFQLRSIVSTHGLTRKCPKCSSPLSTPLPACANCWSISAVPNDTPYHDIFSLPSGGNAFKIDTSLLKQRFREAQSVCHPDTWASKGENEEEAAQILSSLVNHAYQTLSNPLSRLDYILKTNGLPFAEDDRVEDTDFLANVLMMHEDLQEAESQQEVERIESEIEEQMSEGIDEVERLIGEQKWEQAKELGLKLRSLEGVRRASRNK